ncbi:MAG: cation-translocating P-type ATPase [Chloroflexi bacterium]|nr:cation-translocating P-type ATPase [Chloroflexota bacterium]
MKKSLAQVPPFKGSAHAASAEDVAKELSSDLYNGLSSREAEERLGYFGHNTLPEAKGRTILQALAEQFANFLILLLLAATVLAAAIGEYIDAVTIGAIVLLSAALGVAQEWRADRALKALKSMMAPTSRVLRDGHPRELPAPSLVPGDIVLLETGYYVPADLRLITAANLRLNEASLTGESTQVSKDPSAILGADTQIADRRNCAFAGTVVTYGRGRGIVIATGASTELGRIASLISQYEEEETPLQRRMSGLGRGLGGAAIAIAALIFVVGAVTRRDLLDMLLTAVSLAVAAVPEGLPAVITVGLALGVQRMARRHCLVRRLSAVETLGSATIIASDKTGTLTKGEMTVVRIYPGPGLEPLDVSGIGFEPQGEIKRGTKPVNPLKIEHLSQLVIAAALCNDAHLHIEQGQWRVTGDTTEGALIVMASKAGIDPDRLQNEHPREHEIPFSSERKRMTTVHRWHKGFQAYTKGALDVVLPLCSHRKVGEHIGLISQEDRDLILAANEDLAAQGLRILALAYRPLDEIPTDDELEHEMIFLGLAAMHDPPRPEAREAVALCHQAGIIPIMITGDHKTTATAIAQDLGIVDHDAQVLTGVDLQLLNDEELREAVQRVRIYARISPEQKVRIVDALHHNGHIVAMTGDGVNDAPSLKSADIGVAMGITGTDVAKEAADMIITDDNFASIVAAVEEGRKIFDNIRNFVIYLLSANLGEIIVILVGVVGGFPLPLLPIQILWVNLATDSLPALALSMEPGEPNIMQHPPRPPEEPVINKLVATVTITRGIAVAVAVLTAFVLWLNLFDVSDDKARTVAFATLIVAELFVAHSSRSLSRTIAALGPLKNLYLLAGTIISFGLLVGVLYVPFLQEAFHTESLGLSEWLAVVSLGSFPMIGIESMKLLWSRLGVGTQSLLQSR